ncbi:hypothetical protein D6T65_01485 [Arthrobacter frigidicola]|nr:hypothetical protein D6T65_01485 [Arthrobacter frigidicola]
MIAAAAARTFSRELTLPASCVSIYASCSMLSTHRASQRCQCTRQRTNHGIPADRCITSTITPY